MSDILIRDVPDDVIAGIDAHAMRLGLSRTEYVRRALARESARATDPVSAASLATFAEMASDLDDPTVMGDAWS